MKSCDKILAPLLLLPLATGCATILAGRSQTLTLQTQPPGARCELTRDGKIIGTVENTPGAVVVTKTKHDISVKCTKDGYAESSYHADSNVEGATFGNILAGGFIGWGIDSASGADNKYPEVLTVNLTPAANMINAKETVSATPSTPAATPAQDGSVRGRLKTLQQLRTEGLITENEYSSQKAEALKDIK